MELLTARGEAIAVADSKQKLTYQRLAEAAAGWIDRFAEFGLRPGETIAVQAENSARLVALLYGTWCARLLPVILSPRWPPRSALARADELNCAMCIVDRDLDLPQGIDSKPTLSVDPAAAATALFTSGSTGKPRAVVHTLSNHLYSAIGSAANLPIRHDDYWLVALPMSHVSGLSILFRCLLSGATALLARSGSFCNDDARYFLPQTTRLSVVPAQLPRLLEVPASHRSALRSVLVGGQAVPMNLVDRARSEGIPVLTTYGLTEMASQIATSPPGACLPPGVCGSVLPYRRLRVRDGQIEVGGQTLFAGYLTEAGIDPPPLCSDGWFRTGDCGHLNTTGLLTVTGRVDAMFVSGGENIHPQEIEMVLGEHSAVGFAVVVPVPDPKFGARPVAFIASHAAGASPAMPVEAEMQAFLTSRLPRFKHPVRYYPMPTEPPDYASSLDHNAVPIKPDRVRLTNLARSMTNEFPDSSSTA